MAEKDIIRAKEIAEILDVSEGYAYRLIRELNKELQKQGFRTISGRVSRSYFEEKMRYKKSSQKGERMAVRREKGKKTQLVQTSYVDLEGNRRGTTKRGFKTQREAQEWEAELKKRSTSCMGMTMNSFYERYRADMLSTIRESTWDTKDTIIRLKILPHLGARKLDEITPSDIRAWQNEMKKLRKKNGKPYAETYLRTINSQINAMFNHAVKFYELVENPCYRAGKMGKASGEEKNFWTNAEYKAFIQSVANKPESYYGFEIMYWCGLRISELLALNPKDVDLEKRTISITKSYQRLGKKDVITPPKTPKSKRVITIPEFLARL